MEARDGKEGSCLLIAEHIHPHTQKKKEEKYTHINMLQQNAEGSDIRHNIRDILYVCEGKFWGELCCCGGR